MNPLNRRSFLRAGGIALAGWAVAACSNKKGVQVPPDGGATGKTIAELTKGKKNGMQLAVAQQPNLARANDRIAVALLHINEQTPTPYTGGTARAWVATSQTDPAQGPIPLTYHDEGLGTKGVYIGRANFSKDGNWIIYIEATPDGVSGMLSGGAAFSVGRSPQPIPGEKAISVATPTVDNHRGVEPYCTLKPKPCTMHQISLDAALRNGKPTVLLIGTPAFCQSQTCGPVTEVVQSVSSSVGARANFIHIEQFKDDRDAPAKTLLAPGAAAWKLEVEPAVYYIKTDGTIVDWTVGPSDVAEVTDLTNSLLA